MESIKRYYKRYWRKEPQTPLGLLAYQFLCKIIGTLYQLQHREVLRQTERELHEKANHNLKNKRSVFVFANGPSLKDIDLEKISQLQKMGTHDVIAVNSFISRSGQHLKPNYALFADGIHFGINTEESKLCAQYKKDISFCNENKIITFIPAEFFKNSNINNKLAFCTIASIYGKNTSNICKPVGFYRLTALFALTLAKQLKYENIYICGFDNSYFKDFEITKTGDCTLHHHHYYDKPTDNVAVTPIANSTTEIFFDIYRHFSYIEKITKESHQYSNIAKTTYLSCIKIDNGLDIYR